MSIHRPSNDTLEWNWEIWLVQYWSTLGWVKSGHTVVEFGQTWVTRMHTLNKTKCVTMKCQSYAPYSNICTTCMCHTSDIFCNISSMWQTLINTDLHFFGLILCSMVHLFVSTFPISNWPEEFAMKMLRLRPLSNGGYCPGGCWLLIAGSYGKEYDDCCVQVHVQCLQ